MLRRSPSPADDRGTMLSRKISAGLAAAALAAGLGASAAALASSAGPCAAARAGEQCGPGNGRRTAGGGDKVSHKGWPAISGVVWKVLDERPHRWNGGPASDELMGHHGSDRIAGGAGSDVIWGDWDPHGNSTRQRDVLSGGAGNDWIYPSHGRTTVRAGAGNDHVWAFYGKGTIDCGAGRDTVRVRMNGAFKLAGCEVVQHFCAFGSDGHGGCRQPGARSAGDRLRRAGAG
jgi:Ca2+-binding RTX toxin-like protein